MNFNNRLKGAITQVLLETLVEHSQYRVVPLGIEKTIREVSCLDKDQYKNLSLSKTLRSLPDFFVSPPNLSEAWIIEVKYRKEWNSKTQRELGNTLIEQVKLWEPLYLVLFVGRPAKRDDSIPSSYLGVCKLVMRESQLTISRVSYDIDEKVGPNFKETFTPWNEINWQDFSRFQDVFEKVTDDWQEGTLLKAINLLKIIEEEVVG